MLVAKQVADLITWGRVMVAVSLAFLGFVHPNESLPYAAVLMLLSWMSDVCDGAIARRSRVQYQTWIGDHDLQVDMAVAVGLLIYLVVAGYVSLLAGLVYAVLWALILWHWRGNRSLGMLFQAPVYGWFITIALLEATTYGLWLVIWILITVLVTWPRFPKEVVPGFLEGFRWLGKRKL